MGEGLIHRRALLVFLTLGVITPLVFGLALGQGSVSVPWLDWLLDPAKADPQTLQIVFDLRLPRVVAAFCVGGLLAMAGLLMQALLKNPLADPYILGVSGGAGLGGVLAAVLAPVFLTAYFMPLGAAAGALAVVLLVFGLAGSGRVKTLDRLILLGVAVSSVCSALVSLLLTFSEEGLFRGLVFWLLGELNGQHAGLLLLAWALTLVVCLPMARSMNVVVLGEDLAQSVGVPVHTLRIGLYWVSALATGVAV
ncbi:MAG: iron chelate uptake ABC transporter family permease subunit, partial [Limnobacter sp.]|nr:iron chelate uptake ABC transporter family permease subunit [Limnobacter sp.]